MRKFYINNMRKWLPFTKSHPTVSVIRLSGTIAAGAGRLQSGVLNDAGLAPLVERAFRRGKPKAVALLINSPGGSPVQSSLIAARIRRLATEKEIPVYAFVEDVAASGGYWLATAADHIYADASSIVGSIGVIYSGFGLKKFIEKHGVERRVHTAGESKSFLDPFQDENEEDIVRLKELQSQIHDAFVAQVKDRRGAKLTRDDIFDGSFWVGSTGLELGLVDGIGHLIPTMKSVFGDKVQFSVYGPKRSAFQRFGAQIASDALGVVEEKAQWARFGL